MTNTPSFPAPAPASRARRVLPPPDNTPYFKDVDNLVIGEVPKEISELRFDAPDTRTAQPTHSSTRQKRSVRILLHTGADPEKPPRGCLNSPSKKPTTDAKVKPADRLASEQRRAERDEIYDLRYARYEADVLAVFGLDLKSVRARWLVNWKEMPLGPVDYYHGAYPDEYDEAWEGVDEEKIHAWELNDEFYRKRFDGTTDAKPQERKSVHGMRANDVAATPPATPEVTATDEASEPPSLSLQSPSAWFPPPGLPLPAPFFNDPGPSTPINPIATSSSATSTASSDLVGSASSAQTFNQPSSSTPPVPGIPAVLISPYRSSKFIGGSRSPNSTSSSLGKRGREITEETGSDRPSSKSPKRDHNANPHSNLQHQFATPFPSSPSPSLSSSPSPLPSPSPPPSLSPPAPTVETVAGPSSHHGYTSVAAITDVERPAKAKRMKIATSLPRRPTSRRQAGLPPLVPVDDDAMEIDEEPSTQAPPPQPQRRLTRKRGQTDFYTVPIGAPALSAKGKCGARLK